MHQQQISVMILEILKVVARATAGLTYSVECVITCRTRNGNVLSDFVYISSEGAYGRSRDRHRQTKLVNYQAFPSMYVRSAKKIICVLVVWELRALYRGNMDQAPARMVRNPIFNDRTEGNNRQEQGIVSTIPSFAELKKKEIRSSTPDISAENSHQFWLGSDIEPSASNTDLNASATTRNNATGNPVRVPPRNACAHCKSPAHRSACCPHLPCRHCNKMGHVGTHCPGRAEEVIQKRKDAKRKHKEKAAAARSSVSIGKSCAVCSQCKKPYHRRQTCTGLPCRHCNTMGHVGTNCPDREEELAQAIRHARRKYKEKKAEAPRDASAGNYHASCSRCRQPDHRRPACPQLPCVRCSTVGHVVTDCPLKTEEVRQRMKDAQTRHKKRRDTVAGVSPSTALCAYCKQPGHRKPACPNLPCRDCGKIGHVGLGSNCPIKAELTKQRQRETRKSLRGKKKESSQDQGRVCSGSGLNLLIGEEGRESN